MNLRIGSCILSACVVLIVGAALKPAGASGTECNRDVTRTGSPGSYSYSASACYGDCAIPPCREAQVGTTNEYYCECANGTIMTWCYKRVIKDSQGNVAGAYCADNVCSGSCPNQWTGPVPGTQSLSCPCQ